MAPTAKKAKYYIQRSWEESEAAVKAFARLAVGTLLTLVAQVTHLAGPVYLSWLSLGSDSVKSEYSWLALATFAAAVYREGSTWRALRIGRGPDQVLTGAVERVAAAVGQRIGKQGNPRVNWDRLCGELLTAMRDRAAEVSPGVQANQISTNLMLPFPGPEQVTRLEIVRFDRHMLGRKGLALKVDLPGAGVAYTSGTPQRIEDIRDPEIAHHFRKDAPYRSVISIPVQIDGRTVGVVNVDATVPKMVTRPEVLSAMLPFVALMGIVAEAGRNDLKPV